MRAMVGNTIDATPFNIADLERLRAANRSTRQLTQADYDNDLFPVDLVEQIRQQRLTFAGHYLRYSDERVTKQVMIAYFSRYAGQEAYPLGCILEDAPAHSSIRELLALAAERDNWRQHRDRLTGKRHSQEPQMWRPAQGTVETGGPGDTGVDSRHTQATVSTSTSSSTGTAAAG